MSVNANEQRLVVALEARISKYEKDLRRAQGATNDNFRKMEGRAKQSSDRMEKHLTKSASNITDAFGGMFRPFVAGGVISVAIAAVSAFTKTIAEIKHESEKARVDTKVWQQWTYAAKAAGASVDGVTDALKELNIRGDEFVTTGKGSAAEAFERLGFTVADVAAKLKDPSRFLDDIIGKIQKLDNAAQTRIMDEIFGGTGAEELSKMLGFSVEELQKLRNEAATFSDEQLAAAAKLDAEFETMWRNFTVYAKKAALESMSAIDKIISTISWLKGDDYISDIRSNAIRDARARQKLKEINSAYNRRLEIVKQIAEIESKPDFDPVYDGNAIDRLKDDLAAVDREIEALSPDVKRLTTFIDDAANSFKNTATAAVTFKDALTELKKMVPELKSELDTLAKIDGIDAAFEQAVKNAKTPADIELASNIAARARSAAKYGSHKNILDLIGAAEGTDKGRGYNETLGYGKFTGGNRNLTGMTLNEIMAMQKQMLAHPDNSFNSSAVGRYQITRQTLQDFMPRLGLAGDHLFDEKTQDALAQAILQSTGGNVGRLRGRWEGLRGVDSTTIQNAWNGTQTVPDKLAPSESQQAAIDLAKKQDDARKGLNLTLQESLALVQKEAQVSGLSASQQRIELEIFRAQQELARQGIVLSDQELAKLREKITLTENLKQGQINAADQAKGLADAQMYFAQSFTSSLSGLLTGTQSLTDALQNMLNSLIDVTLQALLLGQGPLGGILGGAGGTGLLGGMFGFAEGGYTGHGGKFQPAGVVHKGEYVMSKAATKRIGVNNLETLHQSAKRGYSAGGAVDLAAFANNKQPLAGGGQSSVVTIAPEITVNASGGTPDQNADLAKRISKDVEKSMSAMVAKELSRQQRPGNMIGRRG